jgi:hypothetical protein
MALGGEQMEGILVYGIIDTGAAGDFCLPVIFNISSSTLQCLLWQMPRTVALPATQARRLSLAWNMIADACDACLACVTNSKQPFT